MYGEGEAALFGKLCWCRYYFAAGGLSAVVSVCHSVLVELNVTITATGKPPATKTAKHAQYTLLQARKGVSIKQTVLSGSEVQWFLLYQW